MESLLRKIVSNSKNHAMWLNTLAFLEHIGSRKILKSQNSYTLNKTLLQHISEEARHALFFKKLACQVNAKACLTFELQYLLAGKAAENYFQAIDHKAEEDLQNRNDNSLKQVQKLNCNIDNIVTQNNQSSLLNYLYTTWMIEERAVKVYQLYNRILNEQSFPFNLNFVLNEEDQHLNMVINILKKTDSDFKNRTQRLFNYEEAEFNALVSILESSLSA